MGVSSLEVCSLLGLFAFAFCCKYFVIDSMFPDAHMHVIQDPWLLSPSLLMAALITGVRFVIYSGLKTKGHAFAKKQIEMATPKWIQVETEMCKDSQSHSKFHVPKQNSTLRKRAAIEEDTKERDKQDKQDKEHRNANANAKSMSLISDSDGLSLLSLASNDVTRQDELDKVFAELSLSNSQIQDMKRYRKSALEYDSSVNKFLEVYFKILMTVTIMCCGIYVVLFRYESGFWNPRGLYAGVNATPPQEYDNFMAFYYWISLGYHIHRCVFQFFNHARSDFWAMFIHHWATICLLSLSWFSGMTQTGCLVMFLHDNGDVWLPLAKLFRYNGWILAKDVCFVIFTLTWVIFRMYWFSTLAIYNVWTYGGNAYVVDHPWGFVCFGLLLVLQTLHIYWFILIMTIVKNMVLFGSKGVEDIRSDVPPDSKVQCNKDSAK